MKPQRLASMATSAISYDLETYLIQPGLLAPPLVVGSAAEPNMVGYLLPKPNLRHIFESILAGDVVVAGANIAFDFLVLAADYAQRNRDIVPGIFAMHDREGTIVRGYCDGRVFDVQVAEALHAIAQGHLFADQFTRAPFENHGRYSLDRCVQQVLGRENAKTNDRFRLRYAELDNVPIEQWPYEAIQYPKDDAVNTLEVALAQAGHMNSQWPHEWKSVDTVDFQGGMICRHCRTAMSPGAPIACTRRMPRRNLHDLSRQVYAKWAMHCGDAWGFHTDQDAVTKLEESILDGRDDDKEPFVVAGIIRAEKGSEDQAVLKSLVAKAYGARDACPACLYTVHPAGKRKGEPAPGKQISPTTGKTLVNCEACDGTGLYLPPEVPRAPADGVKKDRDTLQESGDELLMSYAEFGLKKKILTTYIPLLRKGRICNECGRQVGSTEKKQRVEHHENCTQSTGFRTVPLNLRSNVLVETGRTSYADGVHGLPRKGGVRECIIARPGYLISSEDYTAGELVTLAWTCLKLVGYSELAKVLNSGEDAHLSLAGTMLGKTYEQMKILKKAKDAVASDNRQGAKAANFGFPGGMAELTFVLRKRSEEGLFTPCEAGPDLHNFGTKQNPKWVRGYKGLRPCILMDGAPACGIVKVTEYRDQRCPPVCKACLEAAKRLRGFWFTRWPEMNPKDGYFAKVKQLIDNPNAEVVQLVTQRVRGNVEFTSGANGFFQGLLADAAKDAFCQIQRECMDRSWRVISSEMMSSKYAGGQSPLYGSRAMILTHDESICEHPESVASDAAQRVSEIMVESLRFKCPELAPAVKAAPTLMRKLFKGAEPRWLRSGGEEPADANDILIPWEPS